MLSFLRRRPGDARPRSPTEAEVLRAAAEFRRKLKLISQIGFLPPEMDRAAKDTALNRFLEILFGHMRS